MLSYQSNRQETNMACPEAPWTSLSLRQATFILHTLPFSAAQISQLATQGHRTGTLLLLQSCQAFSCPFSHFHGPNSAASHHLGLYTPWLPPHCPHYKTNSGPATFPPETQGLLTQVSFQSKTSSSDRTSSDCPFCLSLLPALSLRDQFISSLPYCPS